MRLTTAEWKPSHALIFAEATCVLMALGLIASSIAPTLMDWLVSGINPLAGANAVNLATLLVACIFLAVALLVHYGRLWTLWIAYGLSILLFLTTLICTYILQAQLAGTYVTVVSAVSAFACWLALETNLPRKPGYDRPRVQRRSYQP